MPDGSFVVGAFMAAIALLYATAGQAGGTAFLAVMAVASFPPAEMRPTSLLLNVVAASYTTWRLHRHGTIDWPGLRPVLLASVPAAFAGGLIVLDARLYMVVTAVTLIVAAVLVAIRRDYDDGSSMAIPHAPGLLTGFGVGLLSGLTGVGGGVFLAPVLIFAKWVSPKRAAAMSAPFILANSVVGLAGSLIAGQGVARDVWIYAVAALSGTVVGTAIHLRWMSQPAIRYVLAGILVIAAYQLLFL